MSILPLSPSRSEVEADDCSQSGDCDQRDVSCCNWCGNLCSAWELDETPKDCDCFFVFRGCEGDECGVGVEGAENGDDGKIEHPHKSDKTASSPSKHTSILIGFTDQHLLKLDVHATDLHISNKFSAFFRSFSFWNALKSSTKDFKHTAHPSRPKCR